MWWMAWKTYMSRSVHSFPPLWRMANMNTSVSVQIFPLFLRPCSRLHRRHQPALIAVALLLILAGFFIFGTCDCSDAEPEPATMSHFWMLTDKIRYQHRRNFIQTDKLWQGLEIPEVPAKEWCSFLLPSIARIFTFDLFPCKILCVNLATVLIDNHDSVDVRYHKLIASRVWAFAVDENPRMLTRRSFENYEEAASETSLSPECTLHKFKATDANGLRVEYDWHVKGFGPGESLQVSDT